MFGDHLNLLIYKSFLLPFIHFLLDCSSLSECHVDLSSFSLFHCINVNKVLFTLWKCIVTCRYSFILCNINIFLNLSSVPWLCLCIFHPTENDFPPTGFCFFVFTFSISFFFKKTTSWLPALVKRLLLSSRVFIQSFHFLAGFSLFGFLYLSH